MVVEDVDFAQRAQRGILRSTVDGSIAAAVLAYAVVRWVCFGFCLVVKWFRGLCANAGFRQIRGY